MQIHPRDAATLGIADGQMVRAHNSVGEIFVPATITTEVKPGAVNLPHGFGHDLEGSGLTLAQGQQAGANINRLLGERHIDVPSGNMAFNRIIVQLEPARA